MKAVVATFNQEKALVGSFSMIVKYRRTFVSISSEEVHCVQLWAGHCGHVETSAANRLIGEVVQSRRRPLLGPSPG